MRRLATVLGLTLVVLAGTALPALADVTEYWDVTIDVEADGDFVVTEVIGQRFDTQRHGIYRYIPVTERLAETGLVEVPEGSVDEWFQRIAITDLDVSSPTAPDATKVERPSRNASEGFLSIRIGEEDTTITGLHEYRIRYRVEGAMLDAGDGTSLLRWDAIGDGWEQPVLEASITLTAPGGILADDVVCVGGGFVPDGGCRIESADEARVVAAAEGIGNYTPLSIQVSFDSSVVAPSEPLLQRRWTFTGALWGDGRAIPLTILVFLVVALLLARLLYRQGRDREARGDVTVDGRTDTTNAEPFGERIRPLLSPRAVPVEYRPPDDLRPGQLGLIIDERVDPVDVAATIVDLAVRGYLVIEELQNKTLWWTRTDWKLKQTEKAHDDLQRFEQYLYDGLFDGRNEVTVSDLKGTFSSDYGKAERALYEDGRLRKWFAARPDKTRGKWLAIGAGVFVASLVAFGLAMYFSRVAVATLPLVLGGLVLLVAHRHMPRRTSRGSALLTRTLGFREFIETAESDRAQFAEKEHLFVEYLPYAVVFGATEKWARAFADLGILATGAGLGGWYVGSHHGGVFDARSFSSGLSDFSSSMGTAAATAPPSSSSGGGGGFSGGGGFGGGGGGSW